MFQRNVFGLDFQERERSVRQNDGDPLLLGTQGFLGQRSSVHQTQEGETELGQSFLGVQTLKLKLNGAVWLG